MENEFRTELYAFEDDVDDIREAEEFLDVPPTQTFTITVATTCLSILLMPERHLKPYQRIVVKDMTDAVQEERATMTESIGKAASTPESLAETVTGMTLYIFTLCITKLFHSRDVTRSFLDKETGKILSTACGLFMTAREISQEKGWPWFGILESSQCIALLLESFAKYDVYAQNQRLFDVTNTRHLQTVNPQYQNVINKWRADLSNAGLDNIGDMHCASGVLQ
jgi:hypothetical protein